MTAVFSQQSSRRLSMIEAISFLEDPGTGAKVTGMTMSLTRISSPPPPVAIPYLPTGQKVADFTRASIERGFRDDGALAAWYGICEYT